METKTHWYRYMVVFILGASIFKTIMYFDKYGIYSAIIFLSTVLSIIFFSFMAGIESKK